MTTKQNFQRYLWLVDTLYSAGEITKEEIDRRWASSPYNYDKASRFPTSTFYDHREAIYELFGIEIACDKRRGNVYFIANMGDLTEGGMRAWLIDTFAISNMVNLAGNLQERIKFEKIPSGSRFLSTIVSAMEEGHKLSITYQRFDRPEPHTFMLAPYCLKACRQRWYMVGKPDDHPEEQDPRVYALDRMLAAETSDIEFNMPSTFNADKFFEYQFSIDRTITKPERISIKVKAHDANYLRTLPIHASQVETDRNQNDSTFHYYLAPTYDFIQELRKHGPNITILHPESLKKRILDDAVATAGLY